MKKLPITICVISIFIISICCSVYFVAKKEAGERFIYKMNSDCGREARVFAEGKKGVSNWEVLQSKFNKDANTCFVELSSPGGILFIYDLTYNKELALYPAFAGQLYPELPGGEKSQERIMQIEKYKQIKKEIFE